jgi:hypothetical protein
MIKIIKLIEKEIDWCNNHKGINENLEYEKGFIEGLKQAMFIIKESNKEVINLKDFGLK